MIAVYPLLYQVSANRHLFIFTTNYSLNYCFANRCMPLRTGYALYFGILYHTLDPVFGFGAQVPSGPSPALYT